MPRKKKQQRTTYNNGDWTAARFNQFVKSVLRAGSRKWPPKYRVLDAACVGQRRNILSGRIAKHYRCAACSGEFPQTLIQVDHINPVVDPQEGFTTWDDVISNLFCEQDNLQVLCKPCHKIKTQNERKSRS